MFRFGVGFLKFVSETAKRGALIATVLACSLVVWELVAFAQTVTLAAKQNQSLVLDGAAVGTEYFQLIAGWDGTNYQKMSVTAAGYVEVAVGGGGSFGVAADDDSAFTHGTGDLTPAGFIYDDVLSNDPEENDVALGRMDSKRAMVNRIEGETRGVSADVLTAGADDTVNTTNGLFTYSALMGYESVGGVWDRLKMDTSGYLYTTLATALDGAIDEVTIQINAVTPQLDSTDRLAVSFYGFNAAAGDTQPTVTTTQADALANTLDTLNVTNFAMLWNATTWDRWPGTAAAGAEVQGASATGAATVGQPVLMGGSNDTNTYQIETDTDGDVMVRTDDGSVLTGFINPDAANNDNLAATTSSGCALDTIVAGYNLVQVNGRVFCRSSTTTATAAITDMPYESPGIYYLYFPSGTDTFCCITSTGSVDVDITPLAAFQ